MILLVGGKHERYPIRGIETRRDVYVRPAYRMDPDEPKSDLPCYALTAVITVAGLLVAAAFATLIIHAVFAR